MTNTTPLGATLVFTCFAITLGLTSQGCSSAEPSAGASSGGAKSSGAFGGSRSTGGHSAGGTAGTPSGEGGRAGSSNPEGGSAGRPSTEGGASSLGGKGAQAGGSSGSPTSGGAASSGGRAANNGGTANRGGTANNGGTANRGGTANNGGTANRGGTANNGGTAGIGSGGSSQPSAGAGGRDLLIPESGAWLGLYYGDASIAATATKLGRALPLHLTYYAWDDDFTRAETSKDLAAGRVPFVNWELFGGELDDILAGKYDDMLQQRARDTKALGKPLFIDFGAEMNGDWSPWGGAQNGQSAEKYVAVYRKVHDAFTSAGASNAIWAFCPNVTDEPRAQWNEALDYYPGDAYVDWMCVDGYNWGNTNGGGWQSFERVFETIYPKLVTKNKPIMIGEMASAESGGDKAAWIDAIIPTLKNKYPQIRGLLWFDVDKETDWRISSSTAAEAAFKKMANDPFFNP